MLMDRRTRCLQATHGTHPSWYLHLDTDHEQLFIMQAVEFMAGMFSDKVLLKIIWRTCGEVLEGQVDHTIREVCSFALVVQELKVRLQELRYQIP